MQNYFSRFPRVLTLLLLSFAFGSGLEATKFRSQPWSCPLSNGDTIVIWQVNDSDGNMYIESNTHRNNSWGEARIISLPGQKALAPCICADNFGNAVVVYLGVDETNFHKYGFVAGYTTGYGWFPPRRIPTVGSVVYQSAQPLNQMTVTNREKESLFVGVWCGFDPDTNSVNIYSTTATFTVGVGWSSLSTVEQISP